MDAKLNFSFVGGPEEVDGAAILVPFSADCLVLILEIVDTGALDGTDVASWRSSEDCSESSALDDSFLLFLEPT